MSACERDGVMLIRVTLHAPDDWSDHSRLYDYGFTSVSLTELPVTEVTQKIAGGVQESVGLSAEPVQAGLCPENIETKVLLPTFAYAPVAAGDEMETLVYLYEGRKIASVPLTAKHAVAVAEIEEKGLLWRLWESLCGGT